MCLYDMRQGEQAYQWCLYSGRSWVFWYSRLDITGCVPVLYTIYCPQNGQFLYRVCKLRLDLYIAPNQKHYNLPYRHGLVEDMLFFLCYVILDLAR